MESKLTQTKLKEVLHYAPDTGVFTWVRTRGSVSAGDIAGSYSEGRPIIVLFRKHHRASRLAWLYMTGVWPEHEVDHEDTNPANNRWGNLRSATSSQNKWNQGIRIDNQTGYKGVSYDTHNSKYKPL